MALRRCNVLGGWRCDECRRLHYGAALTVCPHCCQMTDWSPYPVLDPRQATEPAGKKPEPSGSREEG